MLPIKHYESLARRAADLEEALFELRGAIKCPLKDVQIESAVRKQTGLIEVKLTKISVPTFDGKVWIW